MTMKRRMVRKVRAIGAALFLGLALGSGSFAAGCGAGEGGGDEVAAEPQASAAAEPKAQSQQEPTERSQPAKRQTLELLDGGQATVYPRRGAVVRLHDKPDGEVVERAGHATEFGSRTVFAVAEQRGEWVAVLTAFVENGEPLWLRLDPRKLRAGRVTTRIEVDLSDYRADVYVRDKRLRSFAVSIGMPTATTPTGSFAVTDTFRGGLNAAYGCCAVALTARQVNLPSGWLGGDRIAIHGTDGPLGAQVSHGCVRADDQDVSFLVDRIPPGTPVTIRQ